MNLLFEELVMNGKCKILCVEDEKFFFDDIRDEFEDVGYDVVIVYNGFVVIK